MITAAGRRPVAARSRTNGPVTWDQVAEIANQLNVKDGNGNYTQMGFVPWVNQGWHYTYGFSFGGSFFDYDELPGDAGRSPSRRRLPLGAGLLRGARRATR